MSIGMPLTRFPTWLSLEAAELFGGASATLPVKVENGQVLLASTGPKRFIGDARFTVCNIAPQDHKLSFHVLIDFNHPLVLWTDIILFDGVKDITRVSDPGSLEINIPD